MLNSISVAHSLVYPGSFALAGLLGIASTLIVRKCALRKGWVVAPSSQRHMHTQAVPRLGGVAIFAASVITASIVLALAGRRLAHPALLKTFLAILGPSSLVFAVGLWDDFRPLPARLKLAFQVAAAALLYVFGLRVSCVTWLFPPGILLPLASFVLTILWVIGITNAFNLIDGLDGLAAGSALFSTLVVFAISIFQHDAVVTILTAALAGSILGFLRYNFHPATIFLGDSGSLYIGFLLSAVALAGSQKSSTIVAVSIPVVSFGLPILDVMIAIARRFLSGRPLFQADAEHIHHKLLKLGLSQKRAVLVLYAVSALFGLLSLFLLYSSGRDIALVLIVIAMGVFIGLQQLRYHEFAELQRFAVRTVNQKRMISNSVNIRRAADALANCDTITDICSVLVEHLEPIGFDGFVLSAAGLELIPDQALVPLIRNRRGELVLTWREGEGYASKFTLRLVSDDGLECGEFSCFRFSNDSPLWLDGHVFVASAFVEKLANAATKAFRHATSQGSEKDLRTLSGRQLSSEIGFQAQAD